MSKKRKSKIELRREEQKRGREISRKKRSEMRRDVRGFTKGMRERKDMPIVFILNQADNTETLAFELTNIPQGAIIKFPTLTQKMREDYAQMLWHEDDNENAVVPYTEFDLATTRDMLRFYFGVETKDLNIIEDSVIIAKTDDKELVKRQGFLTGRTKPFDGEVWHPSRSWFFEGRKSAYSVENVDLYHGGQIGRYVDINMNNQQLKQCYMLHHTVIQMALAKATLGQIQPQQAFQTFQVHTKSPLAYLR